MASTADMSRRCPDHQENVYCRRSGVVLLPLGDFWRSEPHLFWMRQQSQISAERCACGLLGGPRAFDMDKINRSSPLLRASTDSVSANVWVRPFRETVCPVKRGISGPTGARKHPCDASFRGKKEHTHFRTRANRERHGLYFRSRQASRHDKGVMARITFPSTTQQNGMVSFIQDTL